MNNNRTPNGNRRPASAQNTVSQRTPNTAKSAPKAAPARRPAPAQQVRRTQPAQTRAKLTPEQAAINRQRREHEKYYAKKRRAASRKLFLSRLALFAAVFVIMAAISAGLFFLNLNHVVSSDSSRYTYFIGDEKYNLPYAKAVRDGRVYVDFSAVAKMCDLVPMGSKTDSLTYVIRDGNEEKIRFVIGSCEVYVNGVEARLGADCYYENDSLYVPVSFVDAYFKGLTVEVNENKHEVEISRVITNLNDKGKVPKGEEAQYEQLSLLLQSAKAIKPLNEDKETMAQTPDLGFVNNLAMYEEYMNPGNTDAYLTVVSIDSPLDSTYVPQDLYFTEATRQDGRAKQQLRLIAMMSLEALYKEMAAAGYEDVSVTSAYRSYSYQEQIFNQYLAQHGGDREYVMTFSNPPGSSEHQTGLCVDMHNLPAADISFKNQPAYTWLRENCWKFGFILRYPEDKTEITGISFEPWHYRYVGRYHAQRMYQSNMCLEEYVAYLNGQNLG